MNNSISNDIHRHSPITADKITPTRNGAGAQEKRSKMSKKNLKTPEELRREIALEGISIAEWSRNRGLSPRSVYEVLTGRNKCRLGEGHRIAVLLGLKEGIIEDKAAV